MEDISRELEREIAQSKPKPYKQDRKSKILIIDDFGKMKSGAYLKKLAWFFGGLSFIGILTSTVLFALYTNLDKNTKETWQKLTHLEQKVVELTREKEMLMAKLVLSGKELVVEETNPVSSTAEKKAETPPKPAPVAAKPTPEPEKETVSKSENKQLAVSLPSIVKTPEPAIEPTLPEPQVGTTDGTPEGIKQNVSVEKFTVKKDGNNGNLLVRFDIRNISAEPGDVSGRIFTILKPDIINEDQWLVVPTSTLEDGQPAEIRKGQYFSIAHFKPVKFRIKNHTSPDYYKKASVYIFNTDGELMVEKLIDITETE